jgi:hypothetical protein
MRNQERKLADEWRVLRANNSVKSRSKWREDGPNFGNDSIRQTNKKNVVPKRGTHQPCCFAPVFGLF